jgi:hypothetical protein
LFALFYQSTMPVAKRQAWTAEKKWYAIALRLKSPEKKQDNIMVAINAMYDRVVSASTLHGWLKPNNSAKIEQLAKASGQNDAKCKWTYENPKLVQALFLWYQGHKTRGAAVTCDLLTRKASVLALHRILLQVLQIFVPNNVVARYSIPHISRYNQFILDEVPAGTSLKRESPARPGLFWPMGRIA